MQKVALDWFVARIARDRVGRYDLKPRDAIHLATAIHMKVDEFHTYDDGLLKLDGKMPGISLRIKRPDINYQIGFLKEQ